MEILQDNSFWKGACFGGTIMFILGIIIMWRIYADIKKIEAVDNFSTL